MRLKLSRQFKKAFSKNLQSTQKPLVNITHFMFVLMMWFLALLIFIKAMMLFGLGVEHILNSGDLSNILTAQITQSTQVLVYLVFVQSQVIFGIQFLRGVLNWFNKILE